MSNDLISRKAFVDALHFWFADGFDEDRWWNSTHVLAAIESVTPEQPDYSPALQRAKAEIEKVIEEMHENGKYHADLIRNNAELLAEGMRLALRIVERNFENA